MLRMSADIEGSVCRGDCSGGSGGGGNFSVTVVTLMTNNKCGGGSSGWRQRVAAADGSRGHSGSGGCPPLSPSKLSYIALGGPQRLTDPTVYIP